MEYLILFGVIFILAFVIIRIILGLPERKMFASMTPDERQRHLENQKAKENQKANLLHGLINSEMICPHCQEKGNVRTKPVDRKKGISGAKATGAILTAGVSILATGLSRKERLTQAYCENCGNTWDF